MFTLKDIKEKNNIEFNINITETEEDFVIKVRYKEGENNVYYF